MAHVTRTGNGLIAIGDLVVHSDDEGSLVRIGAHFLDDLFRERFQDPDAHREHDAERIEIGPVRLTVEKLEEG